MIPLISIVGRPNVGKSTLFNRLLGRRKSIVFSEPGSTRDLIKENLIIEEKSFFLIDSGGFDNVKNHYPLLIKQKVISTIKESDFILFVVDGQAGLQKEDREILNIIRKEGKKFIPLINKIDDKKINENKAEFFKLGIKDFIEIRVVGKSFLYNQVRIMVGTLVKVGKQEWDKKKILEILNSKNRKNAGPTAPACGLYLEKITY